MQLINKTIVSNQNIYSLHQTGYYEQFVEVEQQGWVEQFFVTKFVF